MTKAEKKALYKCTTKGLVELLNDPKYANDKGRQFQAMVNYLARHEMYSGKTKGELFEMIYAARNELVAQAAKKHMDGNDQLAYDNLGANSKNIDNRIKAFLRNPVASLTNEFTALGNAKLEDQATDPDEYEYLSRLRVNSTMLATEVSVLGERLQSVYADRNDRADVMNRLCKKLPENDLTADAALNRANSGFFGRLFRRPSKEYAAFEESFKTFHNAESAMSGDTEDLEKKATAYLKHLMPNFKYSKDMSKEEVLAGLPKGQKARAEFAINVLDSIAEHREAKPFMENVDNAINGRKVANQKAQPVPPKNNPSQNEFQKELGNDIAKQDIEKNPNEIKPAPEKVEEKEIVADEALSK